MPYTLYDFIEAYENGPVQDVDSFLAEWTKRLSLPTSRPPLPEKFSGACPGCGTFDSLQYNDEATRYWDLIGVNENGRLLFDGAFDWADDGDNDRIDCWNCGGEWAVPAEGVDFA